MSFSFISTSIEGDLGDRISQKYKSSELVWLVKAQDKQTPFKYECRESESVQIVLGLKASRIMNKVDEQV